VSTELASLPAVLARVFASRDDVRLAVLFGSAATGRVHAASDVDVAILPLGDPALAWELALQAELEAACRNTVDLVRLDRASPVVRWEAARDGRMLYERTPGAFRLFRAESAIEHDELAPRFALASETYRRAVLAGRGAAR
jgi:predicted nucleotidyltransferase